LKRAFKLSLWVFGGLALAVMIVAGTAYWWTGRQGPAFEASRVAGVKIIEVDCPKGISGGPRCGKIKAPLDYSGKDAGTIDVGFVFYPALFPEGDGKTLLQFIDGGPGQVMSDDMKPSPMRLMRWQFRNRPLLFIDARGVGGLSEALRCPVKSSYDLNENETEVVAACAEKIGPQRVQFTSANTVRDFDLVRRALGFPSVDLIGFSYGTALAPMYASLRPKAVRSITLDGAFQFTNYANPYFTTFYDGAMRQLRQVCERASECNYKETRNALNVVVAALRQAPRPIKATGPGWRIAPEQRLDPGAVISLLTKNAGIAPDDDGTMKVFYPLIGALRKAAGGDWTLLEQIAELDLQRNDLPKSSADHKTLALASTITCQEGSAVPWSVLQSPDQRKAAFESAVATYPDKARFGPFTAREWSLYTFQSEYNECLKYPAPPVGRAIERRESFATALPTSTPILILNGDLDLQTPHEDAQNAAAAFDKPYYARFKHFNHVIMPNSLCAMTMIADFIRSRTVAELNQCLDTDAVPYVTDHISEKMRSPDAANGGGGFVR
jgi:pimeloyl-ACP methyl ester carboxylesterase